MYCDKCGKNLLKDKNDYYMLKDAVWHEICAKIGLKWEGILCRGCAEKALCRKLGKNDLANVPLNERLDWE